MNTIKYRPVGKAGPIVKVRVSQSKRAIYATDRRQLAASPVMADRLMDRKGYVRVNP